jgi:hypothetical protein
MRLVEWGGTHLWKVQFPDAPSPFGDWFPGVEFRESIATINTLDFNFGITTQRLPKGQSCKDISVTFIDKQDNALLNWLSDWINDTIFPGGWYVTPLVECCKIMFVHKLTVEQKIQFSTCYAIFPTDPINFEGTSTADPKRYPMSFSVASVISRIKYNPPV